jgi:nitrogen fixation protein NifU and related proteins
MAYAQQKFAQLSYGLGKDMKKKSLDFWQNHSTNYLEMAFRHDKRQRLPHPNGYGKRTGVCGDTVEMFLLIGEGRVQTVCFDTDGCMNTNACCNAVAHLAEGKSLQTAWEITPEDVIAFLKTLQPANYHCAELAVGALYLALANFHEIRRDPWKRPYLKNR